MRALILSAGTGERLRPLTLVRAKPAIEFLNMPMLAFPYFWLDSLDLSDVAFNTHHLPASVRTAAMHVVRPETQLHFCHEEAILGSGGGLWNARFHLQWDDTFAVANGDAVITCAEHDTLGQMLRFHQRHNALATLLVCPLEGVGSRLPGVWLDKYGEVSNFGMAPPADHRRAYVECLHYASIMLVSKRIWDYLPEGSSNLLYDVLEPAIARGEKVFGFRVDANKLQWFETGNRVDYLASTKRCLELLRDGPAGNRLGQCLHSMLERFSPSFTQQSNLARLRLVDNAAKLEAASLDWSGFAVIGAGANIPAGTRLENCVILPNASGAVAQLCKDQVII